MNYMKQVAEMLGVELGEEFEIKYPSPVTAKTTVVFSENGFRIVDTDEYILLPNRNESILHSLLKGDLLIKPKPWKPKEDERYWSVGRDGDVYNCRWYDDIIDVYCYKLGNCYKTENEANENKDKWIQFYESGEVLEWS